MVVIGDLWLDRDRDSQLWLIFISAVITRTHSTHTITISYHTIPYHSVLETRFGICICICSRVYGDETACVFVANRQDCDLIKANYLCCWLCSGPLHLSLGSPILCLSPIPWRIWIGIGIDGAAPAFTMVIAETKLLFSCDSAVAVAPSQRFAKRLSYPSCSLIPAS